MLGGSRDVWIREEEGTGGVMVGDKRETEREVG